jgi:hypothetical protein
MATIQVLHHSEPGGHIDNEDAFLVQPHPLDAACFLCAVADGQGGRAGGAAAAREACRLCIERSSAVPPPRLFTPFIWTDLLRSVDEGVARHPGAGFTTLVAFCLGETAICGASCGDSAALLLGVGQPDVILTGRQQKNPPAGSGAAEFVPFAARLTIPWRVLAMTDGVWKYAGWEAIATCVAQNPGAEVARAIRSRAALLRTGALQDDFTVVLFQADATPP